MPHLHVSAIDFVIFFAMLVVGLFIMRMVSVRFPDSSIGKALAFIN